MPSWGCWGIFWGPAWFSKSQQSVWKPSFQGILWFFRKKERCIFGFNKTSKEKGGWANSVCTTWEEQNCKSFWALPGLSLTQSYLRTLLACLLQTKKSFSFCDLTNRSSYFTRMGWFWAPRVVHLRFRVYNQEPEDLKMSRSHLTYWDNRAHSGSVLTFSCPFTSDCTFLDIFFNLHMLLFLRTVLFLLNHPSWIIHTALHRYFLPLAWGRRLICLSPWLPRWRQKRCWKRLRSLANVECIARQKGQPARLWSGRISEFWENETSRNRRKQKICQDLWQNETSKQVPSWLTQANQRSCPWSSQSHWARSSSFGVSQSSVRRLRF